jgi:hypothetical protein
MLRENYSYDCLLIWLITPTQQFLKLYHGKNKLISNEMMMRSTLYLTNTLSAGSLKQQSTDRHVAPLGHISLIPSQPLPVFALINAVCLAEKQQIPKVWSDRGSNPRSTTLEARTHNLPHSRLEPTIYHTRDSNPRSTTLETRTHDLPHSRLEPTIYHTRDSNLRSTTLEHANYYTTDVVLSWFVLKHYSYDSPCIINADKSQCMYQSPCVCYHWYVSVGLLVSVYDRYIVFIYYSTYAYSLVQFLVCVITIKTEYGKYLR